MTTSLRQLVGVAVIAGAIVLSGYEIYELVRVGTCGAPPGAVPIRTCPDGTGLAVLLLIVSIFVLPFAGAALARNGGLLIAWWCLLWIVMGSAALVAGHGPAAPRGAANSGNGVGITFLAIGVVSLLGAVAVARGARGTPRGTVAPRPGAAGSPTPTTGRTVTAAELQPLASLLGSAAAKAAAAPAAGTVEARLRKLQELHAAGLVSDAELAERRRRILDEV